MTKVSIVIPAYNQVRYLAQAVESCLQQSHANLEIVVVDDGSTDDTPRVVRQFSRKIRHFRQENRGLPGARNRGLRESTGDYVCFLDSDDYYAPSKIATQAAMLDENPDIAFVYCDITTVDERGHPVAEAPSIAGLQRILSGQIFPALMMGGFFPPHTVMIRRTVLDQVGEFDPDLGGYADYDLWLRVTAAGHRAVFQSDPLAFYRRHAGSMSHDGDHMARTQIAALAKAARNHPDGVARGLYDLQLANEELFRANQWLKEQWETALASVDSAHPNNEQAGQRHPLLSDLARSRQTKGNEEQKGIWDVTLNHVTTKALFLQPPAEEIFEVPTSRRGQLRTAVAIHPEAWCKPGAGGCEFHLRADGRVAHVVALDPVRLTGDRCWHEITLTIPENPRGNHRFHFETKTTGQSADFRWALWRAPQFLWDTEPSPQTISPTPPIVSVLNAA